MDVKQQQEILAVLAPLDDFARKTSAPIDRDWHAHWQAVYRQALNRVREIAAAKPGEAEG